MTHMAITANRLREGCVVYLTAAGQWSQDLRDALVVAGADAADALLAGALRNAAADAIIGPYSFAVVLNGGAIAVSSQREKIRTGGPSVPIPSIPLATENQHVPL
jgi:hypothetical protein